MTKRVKPSLINHDVLVDNRKEYWGRMENEPKIHKRNLENAVNSIKVYKEFYEKRPDKFPKKEKKEKVGKIGMEELANIVLDMNQDIKQIKEAQSLEGAKNWIEKNKWTGKYGAYEKDINGDSIPDVVVQRLDGDGQPIDGNYVIVNGYTTAESTYPYRHAYYSAFPTREERKEAKKDGLDYRGYVKSLYNPQYEDGMKITAFANQEGKELAQKLLKAGYTKVLEPKDRSSYQVFCSSVIKPIFDVFKYHLKNNLGGAAFSKIASMIWNQTILIPAMVYVYGNDVMNVSDEEWVKLRSRTDVKTAIKYRVVEYLNNLKKTFDFVPIFTSIVNAYLNTDIDPNNPLIEYFLKARLLNMQAPSTPVTEEEKAAIDERWEAMQQ